MIEDLVKQIKEAHLWYPPPPNTAHIIEIFEHESGYKMPNDMKEFYFLCGKADLHDYGYSILPINELSNLEPLQFGEGENDYFPESWYAFCYLHDGDYAGIDLASEDGKRFNILDCYHDASEKISIVASSFSEFLLQVLNSTGNSPFWFEAGFMHLGIAEFIPKPSWYKRLYANWWASLGSEYGPEQCASSNCRRLRIKLSVMCRRHHYEMVKHQECPFSDYE
jgi:cell wall assembly regulator SMI1